MLRAYGTLTHLYSIHYIPTDIKCLTAYHNFHDASKTKPLRYYSQGFYMI